MTANVPRLTTEAFSTFLDTTIKVFLGKAVKPAHFDDHEWKRFTHFQESHSSLGPDIKLFREIHELCRKTIKEDEKLKVPVLDNTYRTWERDDLKKRDDHVNEIDEEYKRLEGLLSAYEKVKPLDDRTKIWSKFWRGMMGPNGLMKAVKEYKENLQVKLHGGESYRIFQELEPKLGKVPNWDDSEAMDVVKDLRQQFLQQKPRFLYDKEEDKEYKNIW